MNSLYFRLGMGLFLIQLLSCQVATKREAGDSAETPTMVDPKYSISKDRAEFEQIRKSIPNDVKKVNDEKALMADLFLEVKRSPEEIRDKYDSLARKKRDLFNKDMTKAREEYNKNERKKREDFTKSLDEERKEFLQTKVNAEKRSDFFSEQDEKRRNFSAEQKDKREEFESDIREKRKNFEDYYKEKYDEFNVELKSYRFKWNEKNKN